MILDPTTYLPISHAELLRRHLNDETVYTLKLEVSNVKDKPSNTNGKFSQIGSKTGGANPKTSPSGSASPAPKK